MPRTPVAQPAPRKLRLDAQRNRERILAAARAVFTEHGAAAALDEIARRAAVGPGTLYRHFPTRDALVEAVFRDHVDRLTTAAARLVETESPLEALRLWLLTFIDYVADKLLILPAMDTVPGGSARLIEGTRGQVHGTFHDLVHRAIASGELRPSTRADDFMLYLLGVFKSTAVPGWEASARRLVDLLIEGSRTAGPGPRRS